MPFEISSEDSKIRLFSNEVSIPQKDPLNPSDFETECLLLKGVLKQLPYPNVAGWELVADLESTRRISNLAAKALHELLVEAQKRHLGSISVVLSPELSLESRRRIIRGLESVKILNPRKYFIRRP